METRGWEGGTTGKGGSGGGAVGVCRIGRSVIDLRSWTAPARWNPTCLPQRAGCRPPRSSHAGALRRGTAGVCRGHYSRCARCSASRDLDLDTGRLVAIGAGDRVVDPATSGVAPRVRRTDAEIEATPRRAFERDPYRHEPDLEATVPDSRTMLGVHHVAHDASESSTATASPRLARFGSQVPGHGSPRPAGEDRGLRVRGDRASQKIRSAWIPGGGSPRHPS
jgi:hypothetical protein